MPTLTDSLVSSAARKLTLRARPDLTTRRQVYQGRVFWVLKDPFALNYFRLEEDEFALWQMLDGHSSLDDLKRQYEERFPPKKIALDELQHFVGTLHEKGLLVSGSAEQGFRLQERAAKKRREELWSAFANLLSIRFKGFDPERILTWLYPRVRWFFTTTAVALCLALMASALLLVLVQFDTFRAKLPTFHEFFAASNWIYLGLALGFTKILHEFGHGLTCKHHGGECHEMGVLLLVLTPCLYCNVSDSWLLPNKWARAAIGAGGMYIELCLASVATFMWWFSEPGLLHQLCLSVMFVSSISTLMFNANPLLRYDGYYILSDILEIPNLRQKSSTILQRLMSSLCLGLEQPEDPFLPQRHQVLFAIYSVASFVYGWMVVLGILWFLNKVFEPYGLKILGQMFALASIGGLLLQPLQMLYQFVVVPGRMEKVNRMRLLTTKAFIVAALLLIAFVPLPHRVWCALEVTPRDAESVYIDVTGQLEEVLVKPGQWVQKGDALARLSNIDLDAAIADLQGKRNEGLAKLRGLNAVRSHDPKAGEEVAATKETLRATENELAEKLRDRARLTLLAPVSGMIIAPQRTTTRPDEDGERLSGWTGTPLDPRNQQAWLQEGVLFCQIGDTNNMQAEIVVDQSDVEFVSAGQRVDLKLEQLPDRTFSSRIEQVAKIELKVSPKQLSHKAGGELVTKTDSAGVERPESTSYEANALLTDPAAMLRPGLRGQAKIQVGYQSLGVRFARYLSKTFNFRI
ncbi:MAG TPA: HlyD family efflux transporter periplasmic adaptor subunit [Pirellulales bacterium]|jgi:putative peptide zinc metalloprotease protein|nr:HlyD family efflux transporter periplasmic adaptor subunit [Pirellulales bacterium]